MKKRILICGGRTFADLNLIFNTMESIRPFLSPTFCVIEGGAPGADKLAKDWAFSQGCPVLEVPANWDRYKQIAGTIRNRWMLEYGLPDLVIAFPGGNGTKDMIKQAKKAGIDVYEVVNGSC